VRAATDGTNIDLTSSTDPNPIDGVTLNDGDRVLLKDQTDATENGLYNAATATDPTTWTRTSDADEDSEVTDGLFTFVAEGTNFDNRGFVLTSDDTITLGTSDINFTQFSGAGQINAGTALLKDGDTLNVDDTQFASATHDLGGSAHGADTLANLNGKVSDATLDDSGDARPPETHSTTHENGGSDEISVAGLSGDLADAQDPKTHSTTHESGGADALFDQNLNTTDTVTFVKAIVDSLDAGNTTTTNRRIQT
jgi:hypothetical protein